MNRAYEALLFTAVSLAQSPGEEARALATLVLGTVSPRGREWKAFGLCKSVAFLRKIGP